MKPLKIIAFVWLCILSISFVTPGAPAAKSGNSATTPLTFANAVSFFKAAKFRATEVQPRCAIFFEGEWKNANVYNYCVIMVDNSDEESKYLLSHRRSRDELGDRVSGLPVF